MENEIPTEIKELDEYMDKSEILEQYQGRKER